jgi:uncharacterized protein with HEPN domain
MSENDRIRLQHMLDAAKTALASVQGKGRKNFGQDAVQTLGLVKCVEIIGEAAARVGQTTRNEHPEIPWTQIVAMRNRLVHVYFDVDLDQVWKTLTDDLPPLIAALEAVVTLRDSQTRDERRPKGRKREKS